MDGTGNIDNAIGLAEEAVAATPIDHPDRAALLNNLGSLLSDRCKRLGTLEDLEKAIERAAEALEATPANHPDRANLLGSMGNHLRDRYWRLEALEDLEKAIGWAAEALEATPVDHPDRAARLDNLSVLFGSRYGRLGALDDFQKAIERAAGALEATPADHPDRAVRLHNMGKHFSSRYKRLGALEDLEKAIEQVAEALEVTLVDHPRRADLLNSFGILLSSRYERLGALEDLEKAIELIAEALEATPTDHPGRAAMLNNFGRSLSSRHERLGALEDLDKAIERTTEAIEATPADHSSRAILLNNLSSQLSHRYKRLGALGDIEKAIERATEALEATPTDHPSRAARLDSLGNRFNSRYELLGALEDLEKAIERAAEALEATPADHPDRAARLNNLGNRLSSRYKRLGALGDLEKAIERTTEALEATPADHRNRAAFLNNLGNRLSDRYSRLGALEDLEKAIERAAEAVEAIPENHPSRAALLHNLGNRLNYRYGRLGALEDLEKAIEQAAKALEAITENHPGRANLLVSMGSHLSSRYKRLGALEDLEKAIEQYEEALELLPPDHLLRGTVLSGLGDILASIQLPTPKGLDLNYALKINLNAWNFTVSPPRLRIAAARNAAKFYSTLKRWYESCSLLEDAVKLLPQVSPRLLERDDQQYQLSEFSQLASDAVSTALQSGLEGPHCLSLLELGRGIIMGLVIDCRSSLSELQKLYPELHDQFNDLRTKIDSNSMMANSQNPEQERRQRQNDIDELEELLISIRKLPGLAGFQCPPPAEDLMAIAKEGPIVILNCNEIRSDAIIITGSTIKVLPLPGLVFNDVNGRMGELNRKLIKGTNRTYPLRNARVEDLLLWLWNLVVEPVVEELQLRPWIEVDSNLPRIWWIGVGALSMAPFHAAGDHSPGSTRNTLCRAISSYIPTIKALSYAREKKLGLLSGDSESRLLLVTMPETPQNSPLSSAYGEVGIITSVVKKGTTTELLDRPSATEVLERLKFCDAAHFACHGMSNGKNPSASHLLLCKDDDSGPSSKHESKIVDKLTAGAISSAKIKHAQIAYLSACSSARNDSEDLADESIHIASAFQLAGFSHVLATLWKSNDKACLQVSSEFYRLLFDNEPAENDSDGGHRKVSLAFHQAVRKLRDKDENWRQPLLWASFIHTGA